MFKNRFTTGIDLVHYKSGMILITTCLVIYVYLMCLPLDLSVEQRSGVSRLVREYLTCFLHGHVFIKSPPNPRGEEHYKFRQSFSLNV